MAKMILLTWYFFTASGISCRPPAISTPSRYRRRLLGLSSMMHTTRLPSRGLELISRISWRPASPAPIIRMRSRSLFSVLIPAINWRMNR